MSTIITSQQNKGLHNPFSDEKILGLKIWGENSTLEVEISVEATNESVNQQMG